MIGTSLTEITPDRWTMIQRMAQAFAKSDLVPEAMRDNHGNCIVALLLAEQMNENPLMVMQNIFFVHGRAGWITQYMISRANNSGKFRGPLRWEVKGEGDGLSVTCFADLRDVENDARVEVSVDLRTAIESGWTTYTNKAGKIVIHARWATTAMQTQMLRWRSASWLIRLYAPEVMFGMPTADELEDTMKDVTPPKFVGDDFKPGATRKDAIINADPPQEKVVSTYNLVDYNGATHGYNDPESAFEAMRALLLSGREMRSSVGVEAAWNDNCDPLIAALDEDGRADLSTELIAYRDHLLGRPAAEPASEPPAAAEPPQEAEAASSQPAVSAAQPAGGLIDTGEILPPHLNGQPDWRGWHARFVRAMKGCADRTYLATLIGANDHHITSYNVAFPRLAPAFFDARTKRMEELPDG